MARNFIAGYEPTTRESRNSGFDAANEMINRMMPRSLLLPGRRPITLAGSESPDEIRARVAMDKLRKQIMGSGTRPGLTGPDRELAMADLQELTEQRAAADAQKALNREWQGNIGRQLVWDPYGGPDEYKRQQDARHAASYASQVAAGKQPTMAIQVPAVGQRVAPSQQQQAKAFDLARRGLMGR